MKRINQGIIAALATLALAGCATTRGSPGDPLERINRPIFVFNDAFDRDVAKPIAQTWVDVVPQFVRTGVHNVFANIDDLFTGVNNTLQGKRVEAGNDFGRVLLNTGPGILGIFDLATMAGIEKHDEDFGQTLGVWGVGAGPYLVIPFLGSSSARDALGTGVRIVAEPLQAIDPTGARTAVYGVRTVDQRAQLLGAENVLSTAALDKYRFTRNAYLQRRRYLIYDGKPPQEDDDDGGADNRAPASGTAPNAPPSGLSPDNKPVTPPGQTK